MLVCFLFASEQRHSSVVVVCSGLLVLSFIVVLWVFPSLIAGFHGYFSRLESSRFFVSG